MIFYSSFYHINEYLCGKDNRETYEIESHKGGSYTLCDKND